MGKVVDLEGDVEVVRVRRGKAGLRRFMHPMCYLIIDSTYVKREDRDKIEDVFIKKLGRSEK